MFSRRIKSGLVCLSLLVCVASARHRSDEARANAGYVEPGACADCHREIAESYARTGMARTFGALRSAQQFPELSGGGYAHSASAQLFTIFSRSGKAFLKRQQPGFAGGATNEMEARIDYWFGSGKHARSYISRTTTDELIELPLTWYAEQNGRWAMSPGYDRPDHAGFSRKLTYRCMSCHSSYLELPEPTWETGTRFPGRLPEGIDCQRCHGPGQAHLEAARRGRSAEQVRGAIVNPARLAPDRQMEVCLQCHLETTSSKLPAALLRAGREVFSYRPGEPLAEYILHFDREPAGNQTERFEFTGAAYRLRQSACFKQSGGAMTCTTCHNPHEPSETPAAQQRTLAACQSCHQAPLQKQIAAHRHPAGRNCISCHLPKRHPVDAIHTRVTDHFIQRRPAPEPTGNRAEQHDGSQPPYRGQVEFYYPAKLTPTAEQELYRALAQVKHDANPTAGLTALEAALAQHQPPQAIFYLELAEACRRAEKQAAALAFYQQAAERGKNDWRVWQRLGTLLTTLQQPQRAAAALERARTIAPQEPLVLEALAALHAQQGRPRAAVELLQAALALDPSAAPIYSALGARLLQVNDVRAAEKAWREAVRRRPESATNQLNLANLLNAQGNFPEAQFHFKAALRSAPSFAEVHLAYAIALAAHDQQATAEQELQTTLQLAPDHYEAHLRLGQLLQARGEAERAKQHLRIAADSPAPIIRQAAQDSLRNQ